MNDRAQVNSLDVFDELVDLPASDRRAQLDQQNLDPDTRREVESLLAAHDDAGEFFSEPAPERAELDRLTIGSWIGAYELLELLGEGGFARVFRARQTQPVKREVAVKIIKLGMDTRSLIARFDQERQALARMDHPNIAAIHDAGATDTGRPYFVMELVRGERITRYCADAKLSIQQRVDLFIGVCNAVQHAHQKGILHRDLKPSNILVTAFDECPTPKVIDFGIAKAMQERLTDATIFTQEQQMLGTPQYMSPEHALSGGADVDTRSDVYSLGAVLYELLAGVAPLASADATSRPSSTLVQLQELTSDRVIPPPSTRASGELRRALRGELDWIVGKCLEKDPSRRYESAAALSADLQAFLDRRPIAAAPPGALYRARKFVRRNAVAVSAASVVVLTLLVGAIVSTTMAIRAIRADRLSHKLLEDARAANANLSAVNEFLTEDVIGSAAPAVTLGREMSVREALDNAAVAVGKKFVGRPMTDTFVRDSVAMAYQKLGRADLALPHAKQVLDQATAIRGSDHPDTIRAMNHYALVLKDLGRDAEVEPLLSSALERSRRINGVDHKETIETLDNYASALTVLGRTSESAPLQKQAWDQARRVLGDEHDLTLRTMNNWAHLLWTTGRTADAEPIFREAAERGARLQGKDHPATITSLNNHGLVLKELGRYVDAEPIYKDALERRRRVLGNDHTHTLISLQNYAALLVAMSRYDEAEPLFRETVERRTRTQGKDHVFTLAGVNALADLLRARGQLEESEALQRETLDRRRRVLGADHRDTLTSTNNYAMVLQALGRMAEAEALYRQALEGRRRMHGANHPSTLGSLSNYGDMLRSQGRYADAEPLLAELYQRVGAAQIAPANKALWMASYGVCLVKLGRYEEAEAPLREAYRRLRDTKQTGSAKMREVIISLAEVCQHTNRPDEAAALRRELRQSSSVIASTLSWSSLVTCSLAR